MFKELFENPSFKSYMNLFITFLLANVIGKYITSFVDLKIEDGKTKNINKCETDKTIIKFIIYTFNEREIDRLLFNIAGGWCEKEQTQKIRDLIIFKQYNKCHNKKIELLLRNYCKSITSLYDTIIPIFTINKENQIMRNKDNFIEPNEYVLIAKNIDEKCNNVKNHYKSVVNQVRIIFPEIIVVS